MSFSRSPQGASSTIDALDQGHRHMFTNAIINILGTHLADFTFAQILDGLPTEQSVRAGFHFMHDHPVFTLRHKNLCEGFLDKARKFRARFDASELSFEPSVRLAQTFYCCTRLCLTNQSLAIRSFSTDAAGFKGMQFAAHRIGCHCLSPDSCLPL